MVWAVRFVRLRVLNMNALFPTRKHSSDRAAPFVLMIIIATVTFLTGCGPNYYWVKSGASSSDLSLDSAECRVFAAGAVPQNPKQIQLSRGYRTPAFTTCSRSGSSADCFTTGGNYVPPKYSAYDANDSVRSDAVDVCMDRKGWQLVSEKELQAKSNPISSTPDAYGETSKYVVEVDGYCNETSDCVRGLACSNQKCVKQLNSQGVGSTSTKKTTVAGGYCVGDQTCRSGLACIGNKCVIDFGRSR